MRPMMLGLVCILALLPLPGGWSAFAQDSPPELGEVAGASPLRSSGVFRASTCDTGRNQADFGPDGFRQRVTGRCRQDSTVAGITSSGRGVTVADGDVEVEVRATAGHERARVFLHVRVQEGGTRYYLLVWDPARGRIELRKRTAADSSMSLALRTDVPGVGAETWSRVAVRMEGPRLWVLVDQQPVLSATDEEFSSGGISVGLTRLGSLEDEVETIAEWRNLQVSGLVNAVQAGAPRFALPTQSPPGAGGPPTAPPPSPPASGAVMAEHDLLAPGLVMPRRCTSGRNEGRFDGEGMVLRVTGRCFASSTTAMVDAIQPDVTLGDGEVRVQFRARHGHERLRVGIDVGETTTGRVYAIVDYGDDSARILRPLSDGNVDVVRKSGVRSLADADGWTTLALRQRGTDAWLLVGSEPVLHSRGAVPVVGHPSVVLSRGGSVDDADEVTVDLRNFVVSSVEGADAARPIERAQRPIVDPRYERIMEFIKTDLVEVGGDDPSSIELREIGRAMQAMLAVISLNFLVEPLPEKSAARFDVRRRAILVDEQLLSFTPHVATMLLLHEIVHAHQEHVGTPSGCFEREVDAHRWSARLWRAWFGRDGKQPPGDRIEADFSTIVRLDNAGRLQEAVERIYAEQCEGR